MADNHEASLTVSIEFVDGKHAAIKAHGTNRDMRMLSTRIDFWFRQERENTELTAIRDELLDELKRARDNQCVAARDRLTAVIERIEAGIAPDAVAVEAEGEGR